VLFFALYWGDTGSFRRIRLAKGAALMDARLRILSGPHSGETVEIRRGKLLIGREEDCHLRPDSEFVSRHHCVLLLDDYTLRIRDLGSKNGTFVNGRRVGTSETILLHDDMISIGEMIGQIDLAPVPVRQPTGSPREEGVGQPAMHGTGFFDGDTVQSETPVSMSDTTSTESIATPLSPDAMPAGTDSDTKTVFPPTT
jgi:predicted component of type VI protein secretion system